MDNVVAFPKKKQPAGRTVFVEPSCESGGSWDIFCEFGDRVVCLGNFFAFNSAECFARSAAIRLGARMCGDDEGGAA